MGRSGLFVLGLLAGVAALGGTMYAIQHARQAAELDRQLNGEGVLPPAWLHNERPCEAPTSEQEKFDAAMANVVNAMDPAGRSGTDLRHVVQYFGWHWRIVGNVGRCPPPQAYYAALVPALDRMNWPAPTEDRYDLRLAERLPASERLAGRLADIAFSPYPHFNGPLKYDNRPYARMLLGDQGKFARPWATQALREIGSDTKLATSAAYLAVAVVPARALPQVKRTLEKFTREAISRQLERTVNGKIERAFTPRDGDRLEELAFAISAAGASAQPFADPIAALLDYKFAGGSHFGLLFLPNKTLCVIAKHIGGDVAKVARTKPFCADAHHWPKVPDAPSRKANRLIGK